MDTPTTASDLQAPLPAFSRCHSGIVSTLQNAAELPQLLAGAVRARKMAADLVALFDDAVLQHHQAEEQELFPAVLRSAQAGEEAQQVRAMVDELTEEHRSIEHLWKELAPALRRAARGAECEFEPGQLAHLIRAYGAHAQFEEREFLPLAERILGRNDNHMAALGLSLHLRHASIPIGYI